MENFTDCYRLLLNIKLTGTVSFFFFNLHLVVPCPLSIVCTVGLVTFQVQVQCGLQL